MGAVPVSGAVDGSGYLRARSAHNPYCASHTTSWDESVCKSAESRAHALEQTHGGKLTSFALIWLNSHVQNFAELQCRISSIQQLHERVIVLLTL
jgi:hypothetical protein